MNRSSRISGFYELDRSQRLRAVQRFAGLTDEEVAVLRQGSGLTLGTAERMIENVLGLYQLPIGVATNFVINARDYLVPMVIEEPSVVAAASHGALLVREGGGFAAGADDPVMIGQIQVLDLDDVEAAAEQVRLAEDRVLARADELHPTIKSLGGGTKGLALRVLRETTAGPMLVVHLYYDTRDAMGANAVDEAAEAVAPLIEEVTGGRANLRILSNLADRRLARARCRVPASVLNREGFRGSDVVSLILEAQALAEVDPYRAATHNKGIMNGVDALMLATGNDWRAVEAGAHAYAAEGGYGPLTRWWQDESGALAGAIELPLAAGIVGGATRVHPVARVALRILGVETARELAQVAAALGLSQNLAALQALATEGIQRGHMKLHARQVAMAAGARRDQVDRVASMMIQEDNVREKRARQILNEVFE